MLGKFPQKLMMISILLQEIKGTWTQVMLTARHETNIQEIH